MDPMRLLLIDGHYYLYRSFYAIRGLRNSRHEPTNAIYGFCKAVRKMLVDIKPDRAAVIWDCGLPARRTELQPAYKQNRAEMPEDLRPQEEWLQKNVGLLGFPSLMVPNTEADDLIASYTRAAEAKDAEVFIATNDKDIFQLVTGRIRIYSTGKASGAAEVLLLGPDEVRERWGVGPAQVGEVLALTGDSSDNIPGVPGVGAKTAAQLIREHHTIARLLEDLPTLANAKLRDKIQAARDQILANRRMVALDEDLPLPVPLDDLKIAPRYPELIAALKACEFKGLLKEVEDEAARAQTPAQGELL